MSEFKILWIDDDWNAPNESNEYIGLKSIKEEIDKIENVDLKCISKIDSALIQLGQERFDFIILDFNFKNELDDDPFKRDISIVLDYINKQKNIRFTILSNYSADSFSTDLLNQHNDSLVGIYQKTYESTVKRNIKKFILDIKEIASFSPITFLHLSDFHFDHNYSGENTEQTRMIKKLIEFLHKNKQTLRIDYIILSGDIAFKNPEKDIKACAILIKEIVHSVLDSDFNKLFIVPGNHDISWDDFENAEISDDTGRYYYEFLQDIYINNKEIISKLAGYMPKTESINLNNVDSFSWAYNNLNLSTKILCLNSVIAKKDKKSQGKGLLSKETITFIEKEWETPRMKNELRIAVFHHNILPPFSINTFDGNDNLLNTGQAIEVLTNHGCDLILSGHSHGSQLYQIAYSASKLKGFERLHNLLNVTTSTFGGAIPGNDRAKSFNIINVYQTKESDLKSIQLTPYAYDSRGCEWIELNNITTFINQK